MCTWVLSTEASQLWMLFLRYHSPRVSWDSLSLAYFSNYNWFSNYARLADPGITYLVPSSEITLICHHYWLCYISSGNSNPVLVLAWKTLPSPSELSPKPLTNVFVYLPILKSLLCVDMFIMYVHIIMCATSSIDPCLLPFKLFRHFLKFICFLVFSQQGFSMLP